MQRLPQVSEKSNYIVKTEKTTGGIGIEIGRRKGMRIGDTIRAISISLFPFFPYPYPMHVGIAMGIIGEFCCRRHQ